MAKSTEIAVTRTVAQDGILTTQVVDKVSPDQVMLMLVKGAAAAKFGGVEDDTPLIGRDIKDLLVFPFSEF